MIKEVFHNVTQLIHDDVAVVERINELNEGKDILRHLDVWIKTASIKNNAWTFFLYDQVTKNFLFTLGSLIPYDKKGNKFSIWESSDVNSLYGLFVNTGLETDDEVVKELSEKCKGVIRLTVERWQRANVSFLPNFTPYYE